MQAQKFPCFRVFHDANGSVQSGIQQISPADLPAGDVLIRVAWSSLNFKDVLAAEATPGVAGPLPHVPGIDLAGTVNQSADSRYQPGDRVLVTGYELGAPSWGGWSQWARVPAHWIVPLPENLSERDAMILGTAGFTAAQCVRALQRNQVEPDSGPVVVTGATGGVGCWSVRLLANLGYDVHAVSGKSMSDELKSLGSNVVLDRSVLEDDTRKPMLSARWAGGVDTVGGAPLVALLKSTRIGGCIAACGLVAGTKLENLSIYPFILRGTKLLGVTSSSCPRPEREEIWKLLSGEWLVDLPEAWVTEIELEDVSASIKQMKAGNAAGRTIIRMSGC